MSKPPAVSVIMCALNQGEWVRRTVPQLTAAFSGVPFETIIVDDHSTDGCCHDLPKDVLILRPKKRLGVSGGRRFAVSHASGDVLLFSDPHCDYPPNSLKELCEMAVQRRAIFQPLTTSPPEQTRPRYGGQLVTSERGLRVKRARKGPAKYPALVGTIYAVRREVYDFLGGWPQLPGVWGYSEQALTLMSWFAGVPIEIDDRHCCVHYNYHPRDEKGKQHFSYSVSRSEQASNGHWIHAAFFPKSYPSYWRPVLDAEYGRSSTYSEMITSRSFTRFRKFVEKRRAHTEASFFRTVLEANPPSVDSSLANQQQKKAGAKEYQSVRKRLQYAVHWMARQFRGTQKPEDTATAAEIRQWEKRIPGCVRGQRILDLGCRDGWSVQAYKRWGLKAVGVELVPEAAEHARSQGRPVVTCDMRALPESANTWDMASAIHSLEHVPDPQRVRDEMVRVVRPGGWLFVVVPKEDAPSSKHVHNFAWPTMGSFVSFLAENKKLLRHSVRSKEGKLHRGNREHRVLIQKSK